LSKLLMIDSAAAQCAVAVFSDGRPLVERAETMTRGHAERLLPMIAEALDEAGLRRADLDAVAVCTGPGGFTGARIGVAAARGLALGLRRPAVGVDWFEALAFGVRGPAAVLIPGLNGLRWLRRFEDGAPCAPALCVGVGEPLPALSPHEALIEPSSDNGLAPLARVAMARLGAASSSRAIERPAPLYVRPPDAAPAAASLASRRA
jgi:tRNA threonylcarbamoyl adenosine modification protein YeaZ